MRTIFFVASVVVVVAIHAGRFTVSALPSFYRLRLGELFDQQTGRLLPFFVSAGKIQWLSVGVSIFRFDVPLI